VTDASEEGIDSAWTKLRRRKLAQWGIAYSAGAWGLLQGLQFLAEAFDWSSRVLRFGTLIALIGLLIVLVLAWYHGERGEQRVRRSELAIIVLLFALGGGVFWWFDRAREDAGPAVEPPARPAAIADVRPSIAVLPFENRSRLVEDAFFVDGIHDDILTQLTKIGAMKVIARTSVEQFRDTKLTTKEIGEKLGVTRVLEGGVQRAGDRVRVTVQLIDPATDAHVWAENYDRELSAANLFAIQSEVATAVALALNTRLSAAEQARVGSVPTRSLEAWEAYQLGQQRMTNYTAANLVEAERHFRSAIELDPQFGQAYAALARTLMAQIDWGGVPEAVNLGEAEQYARKAVELAPNVGEAWAALGLVAQWHDDRLAEEHYRKAIQLSPNLEIAYAWLAEVLMNLGREDEALVYSARAFELNPYSSSRAHSHARLLQRVGRFDEAEINFRRALEIEPGRASTYLFLEGLQAYVHNDFVAAVPLALKMVELDPNAPYARVNLSWLYTDLNDLAEAERIMQEARKELGDARDLLFESAHLRFLMGDMTGAEQLVAHALEIDPDAVYLKRILGRIELHRRDPARARAWFVQAYPHLVGTDAPIVQWDVSNAIELAYVLERTGEPQRARELLVGAETTMKRTPRMSVMGYGVADAQIHALRGDRGAALAALREAAQAGWRREWRYYRDYDPAFTSIRQDPEFKAIFADIERDMARQRAALPARPAGAPNARTGSGE
jgi:TolB-like protein/Flp pilus assembly protein TadD